MNRWTWLAPGLAICLSGCVVGPDYEPAPKVSPQNHFVRGGDVTVAAPQASAWWTALNDARLNALIGEALSANSSVEAASARLAKARGWSRRPGPIGRPASAARGPTSREACLAGALAGIRAATAKAKTT